MSNKMHQIKFVLAKSTLLFIAVFVLSTCFFAREAMASWQFTYSSVPEDGSGSVSQGPYNTLSECNAFRQYQMIGPGYSVDPCLGSDSVVGGNTNNGGNNTNTSVGTCAPMTLKCLVAVKLYPFVNTLIQLMMAATVVFFMWNVFLFIKNSDQPEELEKFKSNAVWGIVALAVMVTLYGLVYFITSSIGLDNTQTINIRKGVY